MREHVVGDDEVGAAPRPASSRRARAPKKRPRSGRRLRRADRGDVAAGSTPSTGTPARDEVPQQVAVVARDLDDHRPGPSPSRSMPSSAYARRARASCPSTTRSRRSRRRSPSGGTTSSTWTRRQRRRPARGAGSAVPLRPRAAPGRIRVRERLLAEVDERVPERRAAGAAGRRGAHRRSSYARDLASVTSRASSPRAVPRYQSTVQRTRLGEVEARATSRARRARGEASSRSAAVSGTAGAPRPARQPDGRRSRPQPLDELGDRARARRVGPEVQRPAAPRPVVQQALGEQEVAVQRVEHVLPGPDASGWRSASGSDRSQRADDVGHDAVGRPVAAADHVARARGRDADAGGAKERAR